MDRIVPHPNHLAEAQSRLRKCRSLVTKEIGPDAGTLGIEVLSDLESALEHLEAAGRERADASKRLTQAEEVLRHSEDYFRVLFEHASDVITILDQEGVIRYQSPSIERELGYPSRELIEKSAFDYVHPDDLPSVRRAFSESLSSPGSPIGVEFRFQHVDGSWAILESLGNNLLDNPVVRGVVVTSRNVTDRRAIENALRESEERLRQAEKLEAIGRLAGGVAHDFNNILMVIRGNTHFLLEDIPPESPFRPDLGEINEAVGRAASLTRQLLAFSRKQALQPRVIRLEEVVRSVSGMLRRLIGEHIEIQITVDPAVGSVLADPGQMEQVLINLVVNARDAMPAGGRLSIVIRSTQMPPEAAHMYPHAAPGAPAVLLIVGDTGVGMDHETRERIFEPFFTTKEQGKGTGLGLATVYGIVKQSGGYIWVYSEPGKGSAFKIYLPQVESAGDSPTEESPPFASHSESKVILVVEDDPAVRSVARRALEREGHIIVEAGNGEEAIRIAQEYVGSIDMLITDLVMPRGGGKELAENLSNRFPCLRVLFMSGYTHEMIEMVGGLVPDVGFVEKPFSPASFVRKVHDMLNGSMPSTEGTAPD